MSIFDKLKIEAATAARKTVSKAVQSLGSQRETFTFRALPKNLAEMQALPEASLDTPFQTAALSLCALCTYAVDRQIGTEMLNWLRGPRPLGGHDISFLNDQFRDNKTYVPFSYFKGATPANNYTPEQPFTVIFYTGPHSDQNEGYKKLFVDSGGADNAREIVLRKRGDGKWFLWDQFLLADIRAPKSADPWA